MLMPESHPLRARARQMTSTLLQLRPAPAESPAPPFPRIDIVVPVYNEQAGLERSIRRLHDFLTTNLPYAWRIVIADNASTDATLAIARSLAFELPDTVVLHLEANGRGRALRTAWSASDAEIFCYMAVDVYTDVRALVPPGSALVAGLCTGRRAWRPQVGGVIPPARKFAIGCPLAPGSRVVRGRQRELISRT